MPLTCDFEHRRDITDRMAGTGTVMQWTTLQDGLDNLKMGTAPMPSPGKGEVLVKIKTVSLNYRDTEGTLIRSA